MNRTNNYIENFHHSLNCELDVFHPKLSYLSENYKNYIINVFNKVKEILINRIQNKAEKFSVVNNIIGFFGE